MEMRRSSLLAVAAAAGLMFAAGGTRAYTAKPIYFKGYVAGSFINTTFTFHVGPDQIFTQIGYDTLGGQNFGQIVAEYYDSGDPCTAPDKTIGEQFDLYEAFGVTTYASGGQIYTVAFEGTACTSLTTGVGNASGPSIIAGGSGRFAGAAGSIETYLNDQFFPPTASGLFGGIQSSYSGTVTP
jgi:hypothetical protein